MTITQIIGTTSVDEETAVRQLLAIIGRGGSYTEDLLRRLPRGRVEVHVAANADAVPLW